MVILLAVPAMNERAVAKEKKDDVPSGQPFQALQRQIDELRAQIGDVQDGQFTMLRVDNSAAGQSSTLFFGPTDLCNLSVDPPGGLTGLIERDPIGFRLLGRNDQGCRLIFGPTMDCTVEVNPQGPPGLLLRDPGGIRILNPIDNASPTLLFGQTDNCSLSIDPTGQLPGLLLRDPRGIRILNPSDADDALPTLFFGDVDLCRIAADPQQGMIILDPEGLVIRNPLLGGAASQLAFNDRRCRITAGATDVAAGQPLGMIFDDPDGFIFNGDVQVNGQITSGPIGTNSSRRWKHDVRTMDDAMEKVRGLRGVYFTWNAEHGGKPDLGFIAEEVAEVLPEATIFESDGVTAKGVKYGNLVAVAIEGLKAQQEEIERLNRQNADLRSNLTSLQARVEALTTTVEQLVGSASR